MVKPKQGDKVKLYNIWIGNQDKPETFTVKEWIGNKCFMTNGYYFKWSDLLGFYSWGEP